MDQPFFCPDCCAGHADPGEPVLGHRVRCLDCLIEIELAREIRTLPLVITAGDPALAA